MNIELGHEELRIIYSWFESYRSEGTVSSEDKNLIKKLIKSEYPNQGV